MTERVGIFGGSFCPPHIGHLAAARVFISEMKLDYLYIIPAYLSPGKEPDSSVSPEQRLLMCRLTFLSLPNTEVSDMEIARKGTSYTVDTLCALTRPDRQLFVLCGTDTALSLDKWRDPAKLFSLARFVCVRRENDAKNETKLKEKNLQYQSRFGASVGLIDTEPVPMSATEVRRNIADGAPVIDKVTAEVADYISKNELYRIFDSELDALRAEICARLPQKRLSHVLSVEQEIIWLGTHLMPGQLRKLRIAALLHDVSKNVPDSEQPALCRELGIRLKKSDIECLAILHALSSAKIAARDFPQYTDRAILQAIRFHTTGNPKMTLFDRLLFIADFTEQTRKWGRCLAVRKEMHQMDTELSLSARRAYFDKVFLSALSQKSDFLDSSSYIKSDMTARTYEYFIQKARKSKEKQKQN